MSDYPADEPSRDYNPHWIPFQGATFVGSPYCSFEAENTIKAQMVRHEEEEKKEAQKKRDAQFLSIQKWLY